MFINLETRTTLEDISDYQDYYTIFDIDISLIANEIDDYDYDTGELLEPDFFRNPDGSVDGQIKIGYMQIFCYDVSSIYFEDFDSNFELISSTDGLEENLGRAPIYFSPVEVLNKYYSLTGGVKPFETWTIERGKTTKNMHREPSEFLIDNMVSRLWHFDICKIEPKFRGHDFAKQAYRLFVNSLVQSGEVISLIPHVPKIKKNEQRKQDRTADKTNELLLRYWNGLGLNYYTPSRNILWGFKN